MRPVSPGVESRRGVAGECDPASQIHGVAWLPIVLALVVVSAVQLYAGVALRGLYADGANYLTRILVFRSFSVIEPSRATAQIINQLPTIIALYLPGLTLGQVSEIFSISLNVIPVLLTLASYFCLPSNQKVLFLLPVFTLVAGTLSASFASISDGPTAAALFWIVLFLTLFCPVRLRWHRVLLFALALPMAVLHEGIVFLGPILAVAAFWRAIPASRTSSRLYFCALGIWFLIAAAVEAHFLTHPRDPTNRAAFSYETFHFLWLVIPSIGCNVPALLGVLAGLAIVLVSVFRRRAAAVVAGFGVVSVALAVAPLFSDWFVAPSLQFYARHTPVLLAAPLALVAFAARAWPASIRVWASAGTCAIVLILAFASSFWHGVATHEWASYVRMFRGALASNTGLVARDDLMTRLRPDGARLFMRMTVGWTAPEMSLLLSPHGNVRSILDNSRQVQWQPFDPAIPSQLPKSTFFDTAAYVQALASDPAGQRQPPLRFGQTGFSKGGKGVAMLGSGWSMSEGWGTWSDADRAQLHFRRAGRTAEPIAITFQLIGYGPVAGADQRVRVQDGSRVLADWLLPDRVPVRRALDLPATGDTGRTDLTFVIAHPARPADRGDSGDGRRLGVAILSLDTAPASPGPAALK